MPVGDLPHKPERCPGARFAPRYELAQGPAGICASILVATVGVEAGYLEELPSGGWAVHARSVHANDFLAPIERDGRSLPSSGVWGCRGCGRGWRLTWIYERGHEHVVETDPAADWPSMRPTPELLRTVLGSSGVAVEHIASHTSSGCLEEQLAAQVLLGEAIGVALAGDPADPVVSAAVTWLTEA